MERNTVCGCVCVYMSNNNQKNEWKHIRMKEQKNHHSKNKCHENNDINLNVYVSIYHIHPCYTSLFIIILEESFIVFLFI